MRYYTGPKKCPGCRRPGSEQFRYAVDELCPDCQTLIKLGEGVIAEKPKQYSSVTVDRYALGHLEYSVDTGKPNNMGGRKYFKTEHLPYISDSYSSRKEMPGSSQDLREKFQALLKTIDQGKKASENITYFIRGEHHWNEDTVYLHNDTALAVFALVDSMARWGNRIKKEAYAEGMDLLKGLASGNMTLRDFEESKSRH